MSQITAWKSDADGKVFEFKEDYTKHLRKLAYKRRTARKIENYQTDREAFFDRMGQVASVQELEQLIVDNWERFRNNSLYHNSWTKRKVGRNSDRLVNLSLSIRTMEVDARNSHSCPRGGVQNFDTRAECNKGKPTSYPAWVGRITYGVTNSSSFGSDYFRKTPINTGSGGGGDTHLSYELKLWAADFPVMWENLCRETWIKTDNYNRRAAWRALGGKSEDFVETTTVPADWVMPNALEPIDTDEYRFR